MNFSELSSMLIHLQGPLISPLIKSREIAKEFQHNKAIHFHGTTVFIDLKLQNELYPARLVYF